MVGAAGDALGRVLRPERPAVAVGRGEFHPELLGGGRQPTDSEGEVAGPDPEPGDVPQPARRLATHPEGVGDVLTVGPRLHQAGGSHRRHAHRGAEPRQPRSGGDLAQRGTEFPTPPPPAVQQPVGRHPGPVLGPLVDVGLAHGQCRGDLVGERLGRTHGDQCLDVGPRQVRDLVGDRPAGRRCRRPPSRRIEAGHEGLDLLALGVQIPQDRAHVSHVSPPRGRPRRHPPTRTA